MRKIIEYNSSIKVFLIVLFLSEMILVSKYHQTLAYDNILDRGGRDGNTMNQRRSDLRLAIIDRYLRLKQENAIVINREGNDISDVVIKYIPVGSDFDDAEKILREAGFRVGRRPGKNALGDREDRYDVSARSTEIISTNTFGFGVEVVVLLRSRSPEKYDRIHSIFSYINSRSL